MGQDPVRSSKNNLQLKSDWKLSTNVPGVKTSAWDFRRRKKKKRENNKRNRQSRAHQAAPDSVFKGICFDFIKLLSWSLQKRNALCQEKEDPTGKATSEW